MIMGLEVTCNMYSDVCVCEVHGEGNVTVQLSVVGFGHIVSENGFRAHLADCKDIVSVGT
jgi:hypothetical protein